MTENREPIYRIVAAKKELAELANQSEYKFGENGSLNVHDNGVSLHYTHGTETTDIRHVAFNDLIALRDLLNKALPEYHDEMLVGPQVAPAPAEEPK